MLPGPLPIPAAQYLRVSTDRQEYSLENQTDEILKYAARYGFSIIQTYSDPAISGVLLRKRKGLQKFIQRKFTRRGSEAGAQTPSLLRASSPLKPKNQPRTYTHARISTRVLADSAGGR